MFVPLPIAQTWRLHTKLYKFGRHTSTNNAWMKHSRDLILGKVVYIATIIVSQILDFIYWMVTIFSFDHMTGENREFSSLFFLVRISSKERASVKISSPLCVDFCGNTVVWGSCYFSSHCVVFLAKTKTQEGCATKSLNNGLYWSIRILEKTT